MKVNNIIEKAKPLHYAPTRFPLKESVIAVKHLTEAVEAPEPDAVEPVLFQASDSFKHMLSLIARDNKELYNRIVGLE